MSRPVFRWLVNTFDSIQRQIFSTRIMAQTETVGASQPSPTKLTGRAFYESIGSPKMIVAPMVDRSEFVRLSHTLDSSLTPVDTIYRPGGS